jgi:hypothetical protein
MRKYARWRRHASGGLLLGLIGVLLLSGCALGSAPTWQGIGPNARSIVSLAVSSLNPPTLLAGSSGQGVFRSQDGGSTWKAVNTNLPPGISVNCIVLDPTQIGLVYVGTSQGVFLSTNYGDRWQSASQGLPGGADGNVTALLVNLADPMTLYAGTAHKGVYISHDGAKSWKASVLGLPIGARVHALLAITKGQGMLLLAALAGSGVYQSSNDGASWAASNAGLPVGIDGLSLLQQPSNPGGLYMGTNQGIYRSTDDGASWKAVNDGLGGTPPQVFALALNDKQVQFLYAATSAGVYRSADGGANWDQVAAGIAPDHPVVALAIAGSAASLGTIFASAGQVYRYPSAAAAASGQIFTFAVLGILALLFVWLFLKQRRLLQRLTPPPSPGRPVGEASRVGSGRANTGRAIISDAAQRRRSAILNGKSEADSGEGTSDRQQE